MAKLKTFVNPTEEEINNFIQDKNIIDFNRYNEIIDIIYDEVVQDD